MSFDPLILASLVGSAAFAFSGFMLGVRKELDMMGLFIVAMLTANGGGVLRDLLVGRTPSVITDNASFLLVLGVVILGVILRLHRFPGLERRTLFIASDTVGLVAFSITGATVGLIYGLEFFGVILLGFLTAVGGGILRDILLNERPAVLDTGFYGSVAVLVSLLIYVFYKIDFLNSFSILLAFSIGTGLRYLSYRNDWVLPKIRKGHPYVTEVKRARNRSTNKITTKKEAATNKISVEEKVTKPKAEAKVAGAKDKTEKEDKTQKVEAKKVKAKVADTKDVVAKTEKEGKTQKVEAPKVRAKADKTKSSVAQEAKIDSEKKVAEASAKKPTLKQVEKSLEEGGEEEKLYLAKKKAYDLAKNKFVKVKKEKEKLEAGEADKEKLQAIKKELKAARLNYHTLKEEFQTLVEALQGKDDGSKKKVKK